MENHNNMDSPNYEKDVNWMKLAIQCGKSCIPRHTAFSVGAVLLNAQNGLVSTGFSREIEGNTHAEQCCFIKAAQGRVIRLDPSTSYSSSSSSSPDTIHNTINNTTISSNSQIHENNLIYTENKNNQQQGQQSEIVQEVLPIFKGYTIYTTMEPCNKRLSGNIPCTQWIHKLGVSRVVIGIEEPENFVPDANGTEFLRSNGIQVDYLYGFEGTVYNRDFNELKGLIFSVHGIYVMMFLILQSSKKKF